MIVYRSKVASIFCFVICLIGVFLGALIILRGDEIPIKLYIALTILSIGTLISLFQSIRPAVKILETTDKGFYDNFPFKEVFIKWENVKNMHAGHNYIAINLKYNDSGICKISNIIYGCDFAIAIDVFSASISAVILEMEQHISDNNKENIS